jgi:glycosyltransferase involved in cell wall biosynthesis
MPTALLAVQTAADFGGSYTWLEEMLKELPRFGWRLTVALSSDGTQVWRPFAERYEGLADVTLLRSVTGTPLGRQRAIRSVLGSVNPDVVIPHLLFDVFPAVSRDKQEGGETRLVYCAHEISSRMLADLKRYHGIVDLAVGVSRMLGRILREVVQIAAERVDVIPYGVPQSVVPHTTQPAGAPLRIGYAGRLEDDKRVLDLIPLCEELERVGVDYQLEIAGRGSREQELRTALMHRMERGQVRFRGFVTRDELYREIYPNWDVFILCSPSEGWCIAVAEAMIHAIAPVVSDFRGRREEQLLRDGETALVFPIGDLRAAAAACQRLSNDRAMLNGLQSNARNEIDRRFTTDRMAAAWDDAMRKALLRPSARGIPPDEHSPAGRLDRLLGAGMGETVRHHVRRRSEREEPWPYLSPIGARSYAELETLVNAMAAESREE